VVQKEFNIVERPPIQAKGKTKAIKAFTVSDAKGAV
jgi:hypothetical protein